MAVSRESAQETSAGMFGGAPGMDESPGGAKPRPYMNVGDPLADIFGPGSGNKILSESDESDIPDEVQAVLTEHGLGKIGFRVMLKGGASGDGTSTTTQPYIKSWTRTIPTTEWIAKHYGPGDYTMVITWQTRTVDGDTGRPKIKTSSKELPITISELAQDDYDEFQLKLTLDRSRRNNHNIRNAKLRRTLEQTVEASDEEKPLDKRAAVREYLQEFRQMADLMGMQHGGSGVGSKIDWNDLLKALMAGLPAILTLLSQSRSRQSEQLEKFFTLLLSQSNSSTSQLVEVMKAQSGPSTGREMLQDFKELVMGALDIKGALQDKEDSPLDKVLTAVGQAAPFLTQLVAMRQSQREAIPMYRQAQQYMQADPNFQAVASDPEQLIEMVQRLDTHYGWEQTDLILQAMQKQRPERCERQEATRYPYGDPRNQSDYSSPDRQGGGSSSPGDEEYADTTVDASESA